MDRTIIIADHFQLIHRGHMLLLKNIQDKINNGLVDKCFVCISQENEDILGLYEKESMLNKIISNNPNFDIFHIDSLKMFKDIKIFQEENEIIAVLVEPLQESYIRSTLEGLGVPVIPFKHDIIIEDIEDAIITGDYQTFTQYVPQSLWDEFQNLKELYKMDKISENKEVVMTKIGRTDLEKLVREAVENQIREQQQAKKNKDIIRMSKTELQSLIKQIVNEKLVGQDFNDMYDLKADILKELHKTTKSKWVRVIQNIGKKPDGNFILKMIGSGGVRINLVWGSAIEDGDYILSTGATLIAGESFSMEAYSYMIKLVEISSTFLKFLNEIESQIEDTSDDDDLAPMEEPMPPMDEPMEEPMPPMDEPMEEPMEEPIIDEPIDEPEEEEEEEEEEEVK